MAVPGEFSGTGAKSRTRGACLGKHRSMVCTTDPVPVADAIRAGFRKARRSVVAVHGGREALRRASAKPEVRNR